MPVFRERAAEQIVQKQGAQGFDWLLSQSRQKAREGRASWELITVKQGHEGRGKGLQPLVEGFQRAFTADGVAEEDGEKVDDLIVPEAPPRKAHALTDGGKDALLTKMLDDQSGFAKPGGRHEDGLGRSLDDHRSIGDTVHRCLLDESCFVLPSQRGTFYLY